MQTNRKGPTIVSIQYLHLEYVRTKVQISSDEFKDESTGENDERHISGVGLYIGTNASVATFKLIFVRKNDLS